MMKVAPLELPRSRPVRQGRPPPVARPFFMNPSVKALLQELATVPVTVFDDLYAARCFRPVK
jgi:hypothetical protein